MEGRPPNLTVVRTQGSLYTFRQVLFVRCTICLVLALILATYHSKRVNKEYEKMEFFKSRGIFPFPEWLRRPWLGLDQVHIYGFSCYVPWINSGLVELFLYFFLPQFFPLVLDLIFNRIGSIIKKFGFKRLGVFVCLFLALLTIVVQGVRSVFQMGLDIVESLLKTLVVEVKTNYTCGEERTVTQKYLSAPYYSSNVTRYNMEDVILECQLLLKGEEVAEAYRISRSFWWEKDGEVKARVMETERIHINVTVKKVTRRGHDMLHVRSTLAIEIINQEDYGKYSCGYSRPSRAKVLPYGGSTVLSLDTTACFYTDYFFPTFSQNGFLNETDFTEEFFAEFYLRKMPYSRKPLKVPPRGIFVDYADYWSLAGIDDIQFESDNNYYSCCSVAGRLYWQFIHAREYAPQLFVNKLHFYLTRWRCLCREDFTMKNFTFLRTRYNASMKTQEILEIDFPQQWILIPEISFPFNNFFSQEDETLWMSDEYLACLNGNYLSVVCRQRLKYIDYAFNAATLVDFLCLFFIVLVSLLIAATLCVFLWTVTRWLLIPTRNLCLWGVTQAEQPQQFGYDMYVTYDEEDSYDRRLARCLRSLVEGPDFTVFDVGRDIPFGHPWVLECENAIQQSRRFLVLASTAFEVEGERILELSAIRQTAVDREGASLPLRDGDVFIIKTEACDVSRLNNSRCIDLVPANARDTLTVDEVVLLQFIDWERRTRVPRHEGRQRFSWLHRLRFQGFTVKSFFLLCVLVYFTWVSPLVTEED